MVAEWSAECAADDPVLVVPWNDAEGAAAFIDLRAHPYDLYLIAEAEQHPPLMHALRALNAGRSPVFTAKCDTWPLSPEEIDLLRLELDAENSAVGFASYIDIISKDRAAFASRHRQEQMLDRLVRLAGSIDAPSSALECVLRPAVVDFDKETREGYAVSLYIKSLGSDLLHAHDEWGRTLEEITKLMRSREFAPR